MAKHTPTPWKRVKVKGGGLIRYHIKSSDDYPPLAAVFRAFSEEHANAAFIERACNCHDELLAACKLALDLLDELESGGAENFTEQSALRAAIAKAEGRS